MAKPNAHAPLGQGGRFAALKNKIKGEYKGEANADKIAGAIAAKVGREKYGNKKMAKMAAAGK